MAAFGAAGSLLLEIRSRPSGEHGWMSRYAKNHDLPLYSLICEIIQYQRFQEVPRMEPSSPAVASEAASARRAARQLESAFAAEMMRSARPPRREGGLTGGGPGANEFDMFMNEALGNALAARGSLGLARPIEEAIRRGQGQGQGQRTQQGPQRR
jgi:Rod binding domain-containing protein